MDFQEAPELKAMRDGVRELCARFPEEYWQTREQSQQFPTEFWQALGQGGWLGVVVPEEYGGLGMGALEMAAVIEEVAAGGAGGVGGILFILNCVFGGLSLVRGATDEQRRRYLPGLADGSMQFALSLTEPDAGSNALMTRTRAVRDGDDYILNGAKVFTTNIERADCALVVARTTPIAEATGKTAGLTVFLVDRPAETPGVQISPLDKMGIRAVQTNQVWFEDVRVPASHVLGEVGRGWQHIVEVLNPERIASAALSVGLGNLALRRAVAYAREREVFGRPIGANQGLSFPMAQAKAQLEAARLLNYKAAWLYDQGLPCANEVNMAKYLAAEAAVEACDWAIQVHGGYGYVTEYHVERYWREARLFQLAPVSQQMALNHIAQHVLGLPRSY